MSHTIICKQCRVKFKTSRKSAIYCSDGCRVKAFRTPANLCWYCGAIANSRDHVIPHVTTGERLRKWLGVDIVECCADCNSSLGDGLFETMAERVRWLERRFYKRHKLDKPQVSWSAEELAELRGTLRAYVAEKQKALEIIKGRHLHLLLRAAQLEDIEQ